MSIYNEMSAATTMLPGSEAPLFGTSNQPKNQMPGVPTSADTTTKLQVRYLSLTIGDPNDTLLLEDIMTQSLNCQNGLVKVGDLMVLKEESTFDREGNYLVALKYIEVVPVNYVSAAPKPVVAEDPSASAEITDNTEEVEDGGTTNKKAEAEAEAEDVYLMDFFEESEQD